MKKLFFLGALTLFYAAPLLAKEPPNPVEQKIEKPQTIDGQQSREYRQHSSEPCANLTFLPKNL